MLHRISMIGLSSVVLLFIALGGASPHDLLGRTITSISTTQWSLDGINPCECRPLGTDTIFVNHVLADPISSFTLSEPGYLLIQSGGIFDGAGNFVANPFTTIFIKAGGELRAFGGLVNNTQDFTVEGVLFVNGSFVNNGSINGSGSISCDGSIGGIGDINGKDDITSCAEIEPPLAIGLLEFEAEYDESKKTVNLRWLVDEQGVNQLYHIEKSQNSEIESTFGETAASQIPGVHEYFATDFTPAPGAWYYQLISLLDDGSISTSNVLQVSIPAFLPELLIYPNPSTGTVNLIYSLPPPEGTKVRIFDFTGGTANNVIFSTFSEIDFHIYFTIPGIYFLVVEGTVSRTIRKIVIQ